MQRVVAEVGQTVWYAAGFDHLLEGKIKMIVEVPGYEDPQYIIEVSTHIDDYLILRCPTTISDHPDKPIGAWRRSKAVDEYLKRLGGKTTQTCRDPKADSEPEVGTGEQA